MVPGISTTMGRGVLTERLARSAERQRLLRRVFDIFDAADAQRIGRLQ